MVRKVRDMENGRVDLCISKLYELGLNYKYSGGVFDTGAYNVGRLRTLIIYFPKRRSLWSYIKIYLFLMVHMVTIFMTYC